MMGSIPDIFPEGFGKVGFGGKLALSAQPIKAVSGPLQM